MTASGASPTRRTLQAIFARAAARRAERRAFVETLREILTRRLAPPMLLIKEDRRRTPRDGSPT